jgi:hypothetical protein
VQFDAVASGKRLDAPCRRDSAARRVASRRPPVRLRAVAFGGGPASKAKRVALLRFSAFSLRIGRLDPTQAVASVRNAG